MLGWTVIHVHANMVERQLQSILHIDRVSNLSSSRMKMDCFLGRISDGLSDGQNIVGCSNDFRGRPLSSSVGCITGESKFLIQQMLSSHNHKYRLSSMLQRSILRYVYSGYTRQAAWNFSSPSAVTPSPACSLKISGFKTLLTDS